MAADRIFVNGRIWTGDGPPGLEGAVGVSGEWITAVGDEASVRAHMPKDAELIDLGGKLVVPGFIDNHVHFLSAGLALTAVDLRDVSSRTEFTQKIAARVAERPGQWVLHGGWDHERWGGELPDRAWIDAVSRDTPVFVLRTDEHMALANSAALKLADIDSETAAPPGGVIVRDEKGRITGVLKDGAMSLVERVVPPPSAAQMDAALARATQEALSRGVTYVHDMSDNNWRSLETFRRAYSQDRLQIRVYSFVPISDWARMARFVRKHGTGDDWLRWGAVKGFVDGSLGSTTAWFYEPYDDAPQTRGLTVKPLKELAQEIEGADNAGLHVAVHAIGDRANDWLLSAYHEAALNNGPRDRRFRVEHAQHLAPEVSEQFAAQSIIASMQPYHAIDDGRWAENHIGAERLKGTYAFRSLLESGVTVTFGSDWPVAPVGPLRGVYAAVTRRTLDGENPNGWQPQEKIDVEQAMRAYTTANAYAGFQDDRLGRIAGGFLADFVVLSDNIFEIDPVRIRDIYVQRTVIGGRDAYVRSSQ